MGAVGWRGRLPGLCGGSRKNRRNSAAVHGGLIDEGSHVGLEEGVDENVEQEDSRGRRDGGVDRRGEFARLLNSNTVPTVGLGKRHAVGTVDLAACRALKAKYDATEECVVKDDDEEALPGPAVLLERGEFL